MSLSAISTTINIVGLVFGIVGSYLIWKNGVPPADLQLDTILLNSSPDPDEIEKKREAYARLSKWGMLCLVISFTLQFAAALVSIIAQR